MAPSDGMCQDGAFVVLSISIAATSSALSASELKNCADMMV